MSGDPEEVKGFHILDEVAAKALDDRDYRRRLMADPKHVLRDEGLVVSDEIEVVVVENTKRRLHLVLPSLPAKDAELDVDDIDLERISPFTKF